jgi:hypothetical protein
MAGFAETSHNGSGACWQASALSATSFLSLLISGGRCRLELTFGKRLLISRFMLFLGLGVSVNRDLLCLNGGKNGALRIVSAPFRALHHHTEMLRLIFIVLLRQQLIEIVLIRDLPVLVLAEEVRFFLFAVAVVLGALFFCLFGGLSDIFVGDGLLDK